MKRPITNRKDVTFLVETFYEKVRKDQQLGPIFNGIIEDWEARLERLTDFWEGNLFTFVKTKFTGDPAEAHQRVDDTYEWYHRDGAFRPLDESLGSQYR
ncbi:MAG: group III truncated hemoglobin [Saprospiraceae bacterium]